MNNQKIGEFFVKSDLISREDLTIFLKDHDPSKLRLGAYLLEKGVVTCKDVAKALAWQYSLPFVELDFNVNYFEENPWLTEKDARTWNALPYEKEGDKLTVAIAEPGDFGVMDNIQDRLGAGVKFVVVCLRQLEEYFDLYDESIKGAGEALLSLIRNDGSDKISFDESSETIKFIDAMLFDAYKRRVSDIHIQSDSLGYDIRYRIDGELCDQPIPKNFPIKNVINTIKVVSGLKLEEIRSFQSGRFSRSLPNSISVESRISVGPAYYGESVCLRLIFNNKKISQLSELGLLKYQSDQLMEYVRKSSGVIVFAAPTGEGKSTSLYSILNEINTESLKIITLEDPIEKSVPKIEQFEITENVTFLKAFKEVLRRDPDVIMLGEVRDKETAKVCLESAMSGHRVFTSLHAKNAVNGALRFADLCGDPLSFSMTVNAVVSQRLLPRNCTHCRTTVAEHEVHSVLSLPPRTLSKSVGCPRCNNTGVKGRIAVFEIYKPTQSHLILLQSGDLPGFLKRANEAMVKNTFIDAAIEHAFMGDISPDTLLNFYHGIKD